MSVLEPSMDNTSIPVSVKKRLSIAIKKMPRKQTTLLAVGAFLLLLLTSAISFSRFSFRTKASSASLSLTTTNTNLQPNTTFDVHINVNTNGNIVAGIDTILTYNPNLLEVVAADNGENISLGTITQLPSYPIKGAITTVNANTNKIAISALNFDPNSASPITSGFQGTGVLASVKFKTKSVTDTQTTVIGFDFTAGSTADSNIVNKAGNNEEVSDVLGEINNLSLTIANPTITTVISEEPPTPVPETTEIPTITITSKPIRILTRIPTKKIKPIINTPIPTMTKNVTSIPNPPTATSAPIKNTTAPKVSIMTLAKEKAGLRNSVTINATATDDTRVDIISIYSPDNRLINACKPLAAKGTCTGFINLVSRRQLIKAVAVDQDGNSTTATKWMSF